MTQTDVVASVRPQAQAKASIRRGSWRVPRRLLILPVALLLAVALVGPTTAVAATGSTENGYSQTAPTPKPASGTSPSKESSSPTKGTEPSKTSSTPTTTTKATTTPKSGTLPFTGLNLGWIVGIGLLLMGVGFSIVTVQRRQHSGS